jgi:hypothetical protein
MYNMYFPAVIDTLIISKIFIILQNMKKPISAFFILLSLFFIERASSQSNPFYAASYGNPNPEHWMLTGYYDTVSGSWSSLTPLQQPLFGVNAYYWSQNNKVFICGGATQDVVPQTACWWYNLTDNTYEPAAPLPQGRWSGKLVKVRDSLYLIGSVDSTFNSADGHIFKYSLNQNTWTQKATMPLPYVHECASAVINDSLIVVIGGSTNSFIGAVNYVRVYNPWKDTWTASSSVFPVNNTSSHAETIKIDTANNIIVLGGYGSGVLYYVFRGEVTLNQSDSIGILWQKFDSINTSLFGRGIYRVAGAKWNDYALFGPGMNDSISVSGIWGVKFTDDTSFTWTKFEPGLNDTAGNISTFGVKSGADTNFFFLFGGFKNPNVLASAQKYTFATPPPPIGIINNHGEIPSEYKLWQNYPNPFNPVTKIKFSVPAGRQNQLVRIAVYDIIGREISVIVNENLAAGNYEAEFNGKNLASGLYFYMLKTGVYTDTKKMILIK